MARQHGGPDGPQNGIRMQAARDFPAALYWGAARIRSPSNWWTRSPNTNNSNNACNVRTDGTANNNNVNNTNGCRPAPMKRET